jgi:hypothetical protein
MTKKASRKSSASALKQAEAGFLENLKKRGQAIVNADAKNELPSGVTHLIIDQESEKDLKVKRIRFSLQ